VGKSVGKNLKTSKAACKFKFETKMFQPKDFRTFEEFGSAVGRAKKALFRSGTTIYPQLIPFTGNGN
jgi:hypothetical protein